MHKIEIHARADGVASLMSIFDERADIVGCSEIQRASLAPFGGTPGGASGASNYSVHDDDLWKVEAYVGEDVKPIFEKLGAMPAVIRAESFPARRIDVRVRTASHGQQNNDGRRDASSGVQPEKTQEVLFKASDAGGDMTLLNIVAPKSPHFLIKILSVLHLNDIRLRGGRKYRQETKDIGMLKISLTGPRKLRSAEKAIRKELATAAMNEALCADISRPPLTDAALHLTMNNDSRFSVIHLTAPPLPLVRFAFHQALYEHDIDVSIGRMSVKQGAIDDVYYVKRLADEKVNQNILPLIKNAMTGDVS